MEKQPKKEWTAPELEEYGSVAEITADDVVKLKHLGSSDDFTEGISNA